MKSEKEVDKTLNRVLPLRDRIENWCTSFKEKYFPRKIRAD
jgi:hypothetical protein